MAHTDADMAEALWRNALERTPSEGRGQVQTWCNRHAALLRRVCDRGLRWAEIAEILTQAGVTLDNGGTITAETARKLVRRAGVPSARQRVESAPPNSGERPQVLPPSALGAVADAVAFMGQPDSAGAVTGRDRQPANNRSQDLAPDAAPGSVPVRHAWQGAATLRPSRSNGLASVTQSVCENPVARTRDHGLETGAYPPTARTRDSASVGSRAGSAGRHDVAELVQKRSECAEKGD